MHGPTCIFWANLLVTPFSLQLVYPAKGQKLKRHPWVLHVKEGRAPPLAPATSGLQVPPAIGRARIRTTPAPAPRQNREGKRVASLQMAVRPMAVQVRVKVVGGGGGGRALALALLLVNLGQTTLTACPGPPRAAMLPWHPPQ
jgi:hypothetical protein